MELTCGSSRISVVKVYYSRCIRDHADLAWLSGVINLRSWIEPRNVSPEEGRRLNSLLHLSLVQWDPLERFVKRVIAQAREGNCEGSVSATLPEVCNLPTMAPRRGVEHHD
jgi:hypothetical protein